MPYLPPSALQVQQIPQSFGKDLRTIIRTIEERYRRHTQVPYYALRRDLTEVTSLSTPVGEAGTTKFDPLYGESVDPDMTTVEQAHGSGTYSVADVDLFDDPVNIWARVRRDAKNTDLQRWGFDKVRDLIVYIPCSTLDAAGITVKAGDKFVWNSEDYNVIEFNQDGYWYNTNVALYVVINAEHRRFGS
jgi:hypothetical protein